MSNPDQQSTESKPQRHLPGVDTLLRRNPELLARWGHGQLTAALRAVLGLLRQRIDKGEAVTVDVDAISESAAEQLERDNRSSLQAVLNLSGTVLHTNLGRACLPESAIEAVARAARYPSNLEFDLSSGKRGSRESHVEALICELTGAQAATAVNNNAAAVLLALNTLALGREVPVSRGELVEIGGSFRIPEVMQRSGCTLVEVGATNRTHSRDFASAINEHTALLMKVHTSNYQLQGFTAEVSTEALASLARRHQLPCVVDLGSGCLTDYAALGLPDEPTAAQAITDGADLITFSGDKLLGGPQAGMIAGRRDLVDAINANPLKRALRLDKMTLAALADVLRLYRHPEALREQLPTLRQLTRPLAELEELAARLAPALDNAVAPHYEVCASTGASQIGSGALPVDSIPTMCLRIAPTRAGDAALRRLASALRSLPKPVIGRLHQGALWLDLRCLEDEQALTSQLQTLRSELA